MQRHIQQRLRVLEAAAPAALADLPSESALVELACDLFWRYRLGVRLDQPSDGTIRAFLGADPEAHLVAEWLNAQWRAHGRPFVPLGNDDLTEALRLLDEGSISVRATGLDWTGPARAGNVAGTFGLIDDLDRVLSLWRHQTGARRPGDAGALRAWLVACKDAE